MPTSPMRETLQDGETRALLRRIRGELTGTPAPTPTAEQVARLWWLDAGGCDAIAARLVAVRADAAEP